MDSKTKTLFVLQVVLMLYSAGGVLSKLAGRHEMFSLSFILLYGVQLVILVGYAIGWQQFIKRMPLSVAYANKAATVVWGCVWGTLIFHEHLTPGRVVGALLVLCGVALYGYADGKDKAVAQ